jgi:hypothetical protein
MLKRLLIAWHPGNEVFWWPMCGDGCKTMNTYRCNLARKAFCGHKMGQYKDMGEKSFVPETST